MSFDLLKGRTIVGVETPTLKWQHPDEVVQLDLLLDDGTRLRITPSGYETDGLAADVVTAEEREREKRERAEWEADADKRRASGITILKDAAADLRRDFGRQTF